MQLWTAFILGLAGSLHCAGMCGPLALALPTGGRSATALLTDRLAYNLGRIATYSGLGLVSGLLGKTLVLAGAQRWLSIALGFLLLAGLLGSRKLARWNPVISVVNLLKHSMSTLLRSNSPTALGALGLLNGFLPCGLVYVACAGAVATGGLAEGAIYMLAFGLGTTPMMLAIGISGRLVPLSVRLKLRKAIPASVLLLATLLILRGMSLGIPYLSPDTSSQAPGCCHN